MSEAIVGSGLQDWFQTPHGAYLLDWERAQLDGVVADIFGFHALQLGLPVLDALKSNRMPHRWIAASDAAGVRERTEPSCSTISLRKFSTMRSADVSISVVGCVAATSAAPAGSTANMNCNMRNHRHNAPSPRFSGERVGVRGTQPGFVVV